MEGRRRVNQKTAPHSAPPLSESPRRKGPRKRYKGEVTNCVDPNPSYDESDLQPAEKRVPLTTKKALPMFQNNRKLKAKREVSQMRLLLISLPPEQQKPESE